MKKKLIFITEALWIGGIESALCNLLNRLDYDQYEVTCLLLRNSQELVGRLPMQCRLLVADRQHTYHFRRHIDTNGCSILWRSRSMRHGCAALSGMDCVFSCVRQRRGCTPHM